MKKKDEDRRFGSLTSSEFSSSVTVNDSTYLVHTEEMGSKRARAVSMVYLEGQIVSSRQESYAHLVGKENFDLELKTFLRKMHQAVIDEFTAEQIRKSKKKSDYFDEAKKLLKKGEGEAALKILHEGLERFPGDPFLMSYFGCLVSTVGGKPAAGVRICKEAIKKLKGAVPFGAEVFYPSFYLNLGRSYLAAENRKEAIKAFETGLRVDPEDSELRSESDKMGNRKKPPVPFLKRSNPINRYIGMVIRASSGPVKKKK